MAQLIYRSDLIEKTVAYVKSEMSGNDSSHDWNHIERVSRLAEFIALKERLSESDQLKSVLSALLHDIKDWKYSGSETAGADASRKFLEENNVATEIINDVCFVVANIGFSKELSGPARNAPSESSLKILSVVQDADRLDALGAIGVARCLTYGGAKNRILYDPDLKPRENMTEKEYKSGQSTTMNHFHEKLFKLKSMMKTGTGRQIAESRQKFMENFVKQFEMEWNGSDILFPQF